MPKDRLTKRQRAFINHYVATKNGAQSAINAGYKASNAAQTANENLRKPYIKAEIEKQLAEQAERVKVTGDKVVAELAAIGMFRMSHVAKVRKDVDPATNRQVNVVDIDETDDWSDDAHCAIESIEQTDKGGIKIKAHSKTNALKQLGDHFGLFKDFDTLVKGLMQYGTVVWLEDGSGFEFRYPAD